MPDVAPPQPRSVLVVGAGLAGLRTCAELRARGFTGRLSVIGAEPVPPYDRPPLSKELFTRGEPAWLADQGLGDLDDLADVVLLGHRAVALAADDAVARVRVEGAAGTGETLAADAVVLAIGARPAVPPGWSGALTLHDAADAEALRARLHPGARLVVVGAGWIGAEVAGLAAARGCAVTVVEAAPTPLHRQLGAALGARTAPWYAAAGVDLRCAAVVREVRPDAVVLQGAEAAGVLAADVVLAATGVRPATGWLAGVLPLTARGAVPVDPAGRVLGTPATVRAVGDCADMTVPGAGTVPGGHWDGALTHPAAVAAGLLGQAVPAPPAPYVFSTQFGRELALVGIPAAGDRMVLRAGGDGAWTALFADTSGRLTAGFTVDRPRDVGALRKALAAPTRPVVDAVAAADPGLPLRRALQAG